MTADEYLAAIHVALVESHIVMDNFPHHCHDGSEDRVIPGEPLSIQDVLRIIAQEVTECSSH
ncbi:MAG: hypothetical protein KAW49_17720 [Anaerolineae bacterium]|nr:hypothetical protein [Anaerolineae bacterium]